MAETIKIGGELESTATGNVVAAASAIKDKVKNKYQGEINAETDASLADRYTKAETYNKTELNNMITTPNQQYVSVTANSQTTAVTDVLPATGAANTVYRIGNWDSSQFDASVYSEYAWNGSSYVHLSTKTKIGEVFDISAYHATGGTLATYANLSAALDSNNGGGVPQSLQKGGMSVKYVQSSDNKYVQCRLMANEFTTNTTQWAIVDEGVYVENPEFIYVKTDAENKILWAIKTDGNVYFGAGVPQQVIDYINKRIAELSLDEYEDIVAFLNGLEEGDKTLQTLLDEKVDKEEGKSLIDADYADGVSQIENPEFAEVHTDADNKVLYGVKQDGDFYFGAGVPSQVQEELDNKADLDDFVEVAEDVANKVDKEEGKSLINADYASSQSVVDNPEFLEVTTDSNDKILEGIKTDGTKVIGGDLQVKGNIINDGIQGQIDVAVEKMQEEVDEMLEESSEKLSYFESVENPEWIQVNTDFEGKILEGITSKGKKKVMVETEVDAPMKVSDVTYLNGIPQQTKDYVDRREYGLKRWVQSYGGDRIDIFDNSNQHYTRKQLSTIPYENVLNQSLAIYGDYIIFLFHETLEAVMYRLTDNKKICNLTFPTDIYYGGSHNNACGFGIEKYDENDDFPVFCISQFNTGCYGYLVYRLVKTENHVYVPELIQIIKPSSSLKENISFGLGAGDYVIDKNNNKLYSVRYKGTELSGNIVISEFVLPNISDGVDYQGSTGNIIKIKTLDPEDIIDSFEIGDYGLQDNCYYNGYIIISSFFNWVFINLSNKEVRTIPTGLSEVYTETEGIDVYMNRLIVNFWNLSGIYEIKF